MSPLVYVINLDRAQARLGAVAMQISRFGWQFERVPALDARTLDAAALSALAPDPWSSYQARLMTPGEICCLASHRAAWRRLIAAGRPWALVLEDDAILGDDLPAALRVFEAQTFFELAKLEGITTKSRKSRGAQIIAGAPALYLMETVSAGAAAYCLTAQAARKLLRISAPMNREADFFIRMYGRTDLVVGEFRPFPASQDRTESYIGRAPRAESSADEPSPLDQNPGSDTRIARAAVAVSPPCGRASRLGRDHGRKLVRGGRPRRRRMRPVPPASSRPTGSGRRRCWWVCQGRIVRLQDREADQTQRKNGQPPRNPGIKPHKRDRRIGGDEPEAARALRA